MGLRKYLEGAAFRVFLWEDERGVCPTLAYLKSLRDGGKPAREDAVTLEKRIRDLSSHGPPRLRQQGHELENSDGIYELKASNGARLFWFYEKGHVVVCSHGALKPASNFAYKPHIQRAQKVRAIVREQAAQTTPDKTKPKAKGKK